jgi:hypothetical protein
LWHSFFFLKLVGKPPVIILRGEEPIQQTQHSRTHPEGHTTQREMQKGKGTLERLKEQKRQRIYGITIVSKKI